MAPGCHDHVLRPRHSASPLCSLAQSSHVAGDDVAQAAAPRPMLILAHVPPSSAYLRLQVNRPRRERLQLAALERARRHLRAAILLCLLLAAVTACWYILVEGVPTQIPCQTASTFVELFGAVKRGGGGRACHVHGREGGGRGRERKDKQRAEHQIGTVAEPLETVTNFCFMLQLEEFFMLHVTRSVQSKQSRHLCNTGITVVLGLNLLSSSQ